jgi:hypothetical protein
VYGQPLSAEQTGPTHGLEYSLRQRLDLPVRLGSPHRQRLDDLPLPARLHCEPFVSEQTVYAFEATRLKTPSGQ